MNTIDLIIFIAYCLLDRPDPFDRMQVDRPPAFRFGIGTVEEVGALCVYLASPYARFISGTTILMDGGRSALMQDE